MQQMSYEYEAKGEKLADEIGALYEEQIELRNEELLVTGKERSPLNRAHCRRCFARALYRTRRTGIWSKNSTSSNTLLIQSSCTLLFARHNQTHMYGITNQARYVVDLQPLHELRAVGLNCFGAEGQLLGDLLGGIPSRYELKDLALARRKPVK